MASVGLNAVEIKYFHDLIQTFQPTDISLDRPFVTLFLIFGLDEYGCLCLKSITDEVTSNVEIEPTQKELRTVEIKAHVIKIICRNIYYLGPGKGSGIKLSFVERDVETVELEDFSLAKFETEIVQEQLLFALERRRDGSNEEMSQIETFRKLSDIIVSNEAILWSIWLLLMGVFSSNNITKSNMYIDPHRAIFLLGEGIPLKITMRKRLIRRIPDKILLLLEDYDIIPVRRRPVFSYIFDAVLIPRDEIITVIDVWKETKIHIGWNQLLEYVGRGTVEKFIVSAELGEIMEEII
jgi:hypothetical protein